MAAQGRAVRGLVLTVLGERQARANPSALPWQVVAAVAAGERMGQLCRPVRTRNVPSLSHGACHTPGRCPPPQINYCEEQVECRRVLMLSHFGERSFTREQCRATCDNCRATQGQQCAEEDLSEAAKKGGHTPWPGAGTSPARNRRGCAERRAG